MQNFHETREKPQYPIGSVDRALRLLLMFRDGRHIRLADARDELEVGQSTAHRLMAMLVYHGFVDQDPETRLYRPGPALFEVGLSVVENFDLRVVARAHLEQLSAETGETVHLGMLDGAEVLFLDVVESELALRVSGRVGRRMPAHATSLGKAMLATLSDERLRGLYSSEQLPAVTGHTITRRSELFEELERTRELGYAINREESEAGVASTAVAIVHPARGLVGGINIAAPSSRMTDDSHERHSALLQRAAEELALHLA